MARLLQAAQALRLRPPSRTLTVLFGDDILTTGLVRAAAASAAAPGVRYDFDQMFAPVKSIIESADLAVCRMEVPIGRPGDVAGPDGTSPVGNRQVAPYDIAATLRTAGFDRCSTASNHSNDLGSAGFDSTLDALDAAGISHVGTARTPAEASTSPITVNGVAVAHLSHARYSNTGLPADAWRLAVAVTPQQIASDVDAARAAGAEVVIVSLHIGVELLRAPIASDREFVTNVTSMARIDLVVEHRPHVVQPVEIVNGTTVYWSVGNFVSDMGVSGRYADQRTREGLLATARFTETTPGVFQIEPWTVLVCNEATSRTVHAPVSKLGDALLAPSLRAELQACLDRTTPVIPTPH